jgi:hypothetical protein
MCGQLNNDQTKFIAMKKKFLVFFPALLFFSDLHGENVPQVVARKAALSFFAQMTMAVGSDTGDQLPSISASHTEMAGTIPVYHVFQMDPQGFVIISAQDNVWPVIAFSPSGSFDTELRGCNVEWWMQQYTERALRAANGSASRQDKAKLCWNRLLLPSGQSGHDMQWDAVGPLLTCKWNQDYPYNYYAPADPAGPGGHAFAGCMATAACQICYYYRWPLQGTGRKSYLPQLHPEYGIQSADFGNTWYRFDEMTDQPATINHAVAELIYHAGVLYEMDFDPNGSAGLSTDSGDYYFKLLPYEFLSRDEYSDSAWILMLKAELDEGKPIYYVGGSLTGPGHAFVCDGYADSAYFHFNFGWDGQSDGYYYIDNVQGFNIDQIIVSRVFPDTLNHTYPLHSSGHQELKYTEGSFTDGSGPLNDYQNNINVSWLIDPQTETDSVEKIELNIARFQTFDQGDKVVIHAGADASAPILAEWYSSDVPATFLAPANRLFIKFVSDGSGTAAGFLINYKAKFPEYCKTLAVITDSTYRITDGSGRFNYQSLKSCKWRLIPAGCDSALTLRFSYFDTEPEADYLSVYDLVTGDLIRKITGHYSKPPEPVTVPGGKALLVFNTNGSVTGQGWELYYGHQQTGSPDFGIRDVEVSPNPAHDMLRISFTAAAGLDLTVSVADIYGKTLLFMPQRASGYDRQQVSLPVEWLTPGLYLLKLEGNGYSYARRFIKQ